MFGQPILAMAVLATLASANPAGPEARASAVSGAPVVAQNSWDDYKRIRQGKSVQVAPGSGPVQTHPDPRQNQPVDTGAKAITQGAAPQAQGASHLPQPKRPGDGRFEMRANAQPVSAPAQPTQQSNSWKFYLGELALADTPFYGAYQRDFKWAYSHRIPLSNTPRIVVSMHGSGGGQGAMRVFGPSALGDLEVRNQDAEAYSQSLREWWTFGPQFRPAPGRRIAATLHYLQKRYKFNVDKYGIVLEGSSMGGAGAVVQTMILPSPWREKIAWSSARAGIVMPRRVYARQPGQYRNFPPDAGWGTWLWDRIDFAVQAARDPVVRGIHYRHAFGTNDQFSDGPDGSTILEFVNIVEENRIGGAFSWTQGGHGVGEAGFNMPMLSVFEAPEQDVTLDRAHPAFTRSTGNYPRSPVDRLDEQRFPRGHYNLGILWNHAGIIDDKTQLVFPLRYVARSGFGKGVPDQPRNITVSVTPRRPAHFAFHDGQRLNWTWDDGALFGTAVVQGDTVTIDNIPLDSGQPYKKLRIFH